MSKWAQEDAGEERLTAKSKLMMNLVSRYSVRDPNVLASTASESPGKTKSELSSNQEQGDLFWTLTHQIIQSGMLTRIGLLKSGNLMN